MTHQYQAFIKTLRDRLQGPLPGFESQKKLEPVTRKKYLETADISKARPSGVMLLFFPENNEARLIFMKRTEYNGVHSGQISFPGGRYEEFDKNLRQTALRETHEEIGVRPEMINIVGKLTQLYIPPSNFIVEPWVGYLNEKPDFIPDPDEVSEIFSVPLSKLLDKNALQTKPIRTTSGRVDVACYYVNQRVIWGATSMILSEMLDVIRNGNA